MINLAIMIVICLGIGLSGTFFTAPNIPGWYAALNKPGFTPPNWIFGPVWTFLYISMGIAAFWIWKKGFERRDVEIALGVFGGQLILNALWTPLFFGMHWLLLALVEIVILWFFILWTIILFYRIEKPAGLLLIPYLCWVSYASALNLAVWLMN
jgi:tryptophan-rich sensory protein